MKIFIVVMQKMKLLAQMMILIACVMLSCCTSEPQQETFPELVQHVNPFIGTGGKGNTYPGATVPHGMVQLSPDNGRNGWDWISGYYYPDSVIAGFSHLHLSGTGAGDLYDISFMPLTYPIRKERLDSINPKTTIVSKFSHENEAAKPGYYQVYLDDYDVNVELTTTTRTGLQQYAFMQADTAMIRLDLGYSRNWDGTQESHLMVVNDTTIMGYRFSNGWARKQTVYFYAVFSQPILSHQIFNKNESIEGNEATAVDLSGEFIFDINPGDVILIKTGISAVSMANAKENLLAEQPQFDFNLVLKNAQDRWETALSRVTIEADEDTKTQFYTAMYHSLLVPSVFSDVNGDYKSPNGRTLNNLEAVRYSTFSLWDTFRALHPWLTIVHPEKVPDMIHSLVGFQQESGALPVWNMHGSETNMMIGYHSVPVLADAASKGLTEIDVKSLLAAAKASAMQDDFGLKSYKQLGYIPHDETNWNVSKTMEYAYDDWCIAQIAKMAEAAEDYQYYLQRSNNYLNHFDSTTDFFRAKSSEGTFKTPFNPLAYRPEDYCEGNAWQYYWFVPHDVAKLVELTGGAESFSNKLDQMFASAQEGEQPEWISGYIGQYVHGNEPGHHVPYLYQFVDQPHKTQQRVRQIMDELYNTKPDGLCGNEDCGQMSAWYLFSALGFYPVNPASGAYVFGSPKIKQAVIQLPGNKQFSIVAKNQSKKNILVKSISLNGEKLSSFYISHDQIMNGGELVFEMTDQN